MAVRARVCSVLLFTVACSSEPANVPGEGACAGPAVLLRFDDPVPQDGRLLVEFLGASGELVGSCLIEMTPSTSGASGAVGVVEGGARLIEGCDGDFSFPMAMDGSHGEVGFLLPFDEYRVEGGVVIAAGLPSGLTLRLLMDGRLVFDDYLEFSFDEETEASCQKSVHALDVDW